MWKFLTVFVLLSGGTDILHAQDSLLKALEGLQTRAPGGFFFPGTFPSYRVHGVTRPDNNIFFTGLIVLGLENIRDRLNPGDRTICDSIIARAQRSYRFFRNLGGRPTYNFWRTDPPVIFPGDPLLRYLNRTHALPDDLDDTSILTATEDIPDSAARRLHRLMGEYANTIHRQEHNYYRRYKRVPAYSTWFGKRMPVDLDCCVLSNVLYWVSKAGLPFDREDSAAAYLLRDMLTRGLPWKDPAYASPHYGRTPVILYHLARLVGSFPIPGLDSLKPLLAYEVRRALDTAKDPMDRVILTTSCVRLGDRGMHLPPAGGVADIRDRHFVFFIASFSDYFRNPFRRIFLHSGFIRWGFECPAYNMLLLLECAELTGQGGAI